MRKSTQLNVFILCTWVNLGNHIYETFGNIRVMHFSETIFGIECTTLEKKMVKGTFPKIG